MNEKEKFVSDLKKLLGNYVKCGLQNDGWPCNSCFHTYFEDLGFDADFIHDFWTFVLSVRGDYNTKQLKEWIKNEKN